MIAALSKHLQLPLGPLEAEAMAMDEAVSFTWYIGVRDVVFETDSSMVTEALRLCLFWVKIISGNAFPEMRVFGWSGK